jgi:hypothetical protein
MRPVEVHRVFTEQQQYESWMGGNLNDAMLFRGLRLHFDACNEKGPLVNSRLNLIVIHERQDVDLFGRPIGEWTREHLVQELQANGIAFDLPKTGDVLVHPGMALSFNAEGQLVWIEIEEDA